MGAATQPPPGEEDDPLVEVGRFERPHGVRGEIAFFTGEGGAPAEPLPYRRLVAGGRLLEITSSRPKGDRLLLTIEGIETPEAARALTGLAGQVHESELPEVPEGSYYLRDLLGMKVVDVASGVVAGHVQEVQRLAGRDYLEIEKGALIPFADELIVSVDLELRTIEMRIPAGLLDLDAAGEAGP